MKPFLSWRLACEDPGFRLLGSSEGKLVGNEPKKNKAVWRERG